MKSRVWSRKRVNTVTVWMLLGALVCFVFPAEQAFWDSVGWGGWGTDNVDSVHPVDPDMHIAGWHDGPGGD